FNMIAGVIPHDPGNLGLVERLGPVLMASSTALHGLDVTPASTEATFHFRKKGENFDVTLNPQVPVYFLFGYSQNPGWVSARMDGPLPLWLRNTDDNWAEFVPSANMEYVAFNHVLDGKNQTLKEFFDSVFAVVDRE